MRIAVTGAGGLLGRCFSGVAGAAHDVLPLTSADLDVTQPEAVSRALRELKPDTVVHCAAYTRVDEAESDRARAMEVNRGGAEWVARAACDTGAFVLYPSTDYVFDGEKRAPYVETDTPRPLSIYGTSKLEGEKRVLAVLPDRSLIVRTAWLYGAGAGFVDWVFERLSAGPPPRLVFDQEGSPTYAVDLARALVVLIERRARGIFHFANRGATTWFGLGQAVAEMTGRAGAPLEAMRAADLSRPARRPAYSVLSADKYERVTGGRVPPWWDGLERYVTERGWHPS